jgi:tetratricopeptide (TPR) repeat protein/LysM repeat protein
MKAAQYIKVETPLIYTVQKGETALSISRKFKVNIDELVELNKLNPASIQINIGQKIKIPQSAVTVDQSTDSEKTNKGDQIKVSPGKSKLGIAESPSTQAASLNSIMNPVPDQMKIERDSLAGSIALDSLNSEKKLKNLDRLISLIELRISDLKKYNDTILSRRSRIIDENDLDAMLLKMKESRMLASIESENKKNIDSLQQNLQLYRSRKESLQKQILLFSDQSTVREKQIRESLIDARKDVIFTDPGIEKPAVAAPGNKSESDFKVKPKVRKDKNDPNQASSTQEAELPKTEFQKTVRSKESKKLMVEASAQDSLQTYMIKEVEIKKRKRLPYYMIRPDTLRQIKSEFTLNRAAQMYNTAQVNAAEKLIRRAIELNPNNPEAWMFHGDLSARFGYPEKAIKDYRIALEISPNEAQVHYNLAVTYQALYKLKDAYNSYSDCIKTDPDYLLAYIGRAGILMEQKEYPAAIDDYSLVINKSPYMTLALKGRGIARLANKEFAPAIADFNRFLELDKPEASVFHQRGLAKILNGDLLNGCMDLSSAVHMGRKEAQADIQKFCN